MHTWPVQDAKARFSQFLDTCLVEGPQMVTRRGAETAVLVPVHEWRRLQSAARPSLKQLLLSEQARSDLAVPARGNAKRRNVEPMLSRAAICLTRMRFVSSASSAHMQASLLGWNRLMTPSCTFAQ